MPLSGNPCYARAFSKRTLSSWLYFNCRIGLSVCRQRQSDPTIGKMLFWSGIFLILWFKNVNTHVWERQAFERSRVCLRLEHVAIDFTRQLYICFLEILKFQKFQIISWTIVPTYSRRFWFTVSAFQQYIDQCLCIQQNCNTNTNIVDGNTGQPQLIQRPLPASRIAIAITYGRLVYCVVWDPSVLQCLGACLLGHIWVVKILTTARLLKLQNWQKNKA